MAKQKVTVEEKLRFLYDLQLIDSKVDEIRDVRGELPLEVEDLKDEVAGLNKRLENHETEVEELNNEIKNKKVAIENAKAFSKKYEEQQKNVRNNREYNSITKEIEYQELEIQLAEKRINEYKVRIEQKNEVIDETKKKVKDKEGLLNLKSSELDTIMKETEREEDALLVKAKEYGSKIDDQLLKSYQRIRARVKNGLAIVTIDRGASKGSFFTIPPQVQVEIANRNKIITDEHSGRILIDNELAEEEKQKIEKVIQAALK